VRPVESCRLWRYTWFDRFRLVVAVVIFISIWIAWFVHWAQFLLAFGLPRRLFDWVLVVTSVEVRSVLLVCGLVVVGLYAAAYAWQRRVWQSGGTRS
jgi:hypothetical protein